MRLSKGQKDIEKWFNAEINRIFNGSVNKAIKLEIKNDDRAKVKA